VALLDRAIAALRARQPHDAREVLSIYEQEIGERGQLARDAAELAIEISCTTHARDVADRLAAFAKRWPRLAAHARAACARAIAP
jgi:hypothetical protein